MMPFHGVRNILAFNWPFYVLALSTVVGAALFFPHPLAIAAVLIAAYFAIASLAASHLVYDSGAVYGWQWLPPEVVKARAILNVHAGFDETTLSLQEKVDGRVFPFQFYDAALNTEPSIARAQSHGDATRFKAGALPCRDASCDAILFLFSAHEIRRPEERDRCLGDAARVVRQGGRVVILEHLRNARTFAVFGPGNFHFYPRQEWLRVAKAAELTLLDEGDLTPFAHYFVLERVS
jgi:SAM-dependent methyltransferase